MCHGICSGVLGAQNVVFYIEHSKTQPASINFQRQKELRLAVQTVIMRNTLNTLCCGCFATVRHQHAVLCDQDPPLARISRQNRASCRPRGPYVAISRMLKLSIAAAVLDVVGLAPGAQAQTAIWDETLSNSFWYVPVPQLLAYGQRAAALPIRFQLATRRCGPLAAAWAACSLAPAMPHW